MPKFDRLLTSLRSTNASYNHLNAKKTTGLDTIRLHLLTSMVRVKGELEAELETFLKPLTGEYPNIFTDLMRLEAEITELFAQTDALAKTATTQGDQDKRTELTQTRDQLVVEHAKIMKIARDYERTLGDRADIYVQNH